MGEETEKIVAVWMLMVETGQIANLFGNCGGRQLHPGFSDAQDGAAALEIGGPLYTMISLARTGPFARH